MYNENGYYNPFIESNTKLLSHTIKIFLNVVLSIRYFIWIIHKK